MRLPRSLVIGAFLVLAACGGRDRDFALTEFRGTREGPDEFAVLPSKPLETPADLAALPAPTPGAANRTDQNPLADGVAAFGGNPAALAATGIPAADSSIVRHVSRYGTDPGIRQKLASEDEAFRLRRWRLNRWKIDKRDLYNEVYKRDWLNAYAELRRLRDRGIVTPTAPPGQ